MDKGPSAAPDRKIGTHSTAFGVNLRAWLEKDDVLNTMTVDQFRAWTERRQA